MGPHSLTCLSGPFNYRQCPMNLTPLPQDSLRHFHKGSCPFIPGCRLNMHCGISPMQRWNMLKMNAVTVARNVTLLQWLLPKNTEHLNIFLFKLFAPTHPLKTSIFVQQQTRFDYHHICNEKIFQKITGPLCMGIKAWSFTPYPHLERRSNTRTTFLDIIWCDKVVWIHLADNSIPARTL